MSEPEILVPEDMPPEKFEPIPPIHPGKDLGEIIGELEISPELLAETMHVPIGNRHEIIDGNHPITGDIAVRLGKVFYMTPETWLNLQKHYELEEAKISTDTSFIVPLVPPPDEELLRAPVAKHISL